jgi:hypothetical protein
MAETFKNAKAAIGNTATTIYTCPSATTAIIIGCFIANVDGTNSADITLTWTDDSDSDAITNICKAIGVPPGATLTPIGGSNGKVVLQSGDVLKGTASAASDLEATVAVLEIS